MPKSKFANPSSRITFRPRVPYVNGISASAAVLNHWVLVCLNPDGSSGPIKLGLCPPLPTLATSCEARIPNGNPLLMLRMPVTCHPERNFRSIQLEPFRNGLPVPNGRSYTKLGTKL